MRTIRSNLGFQVFRQAFAVALPAVGLFSTALIGGSTSAAATWDELEPVSELVVHAADKIRIYMPAAATSYTAAAATLAGKAVATTGRMTTVRSPDLSEVQLVTAVAVLAVLGIWTLLRVGWLKKCNDTVIEAMRELGSGNLDARVAPKRWSESGGLTLAFDEMAAGLRRRMRLLEAKSLPLRDTAQAAKAQAAAWAECGREMRGQISDVCRLAEQITDPKHEWDERTKFARELRRHTEALRAAIERVIQTSATDGARQKQPLVQPRGNPTFTARAAGGRTDTTAAPWTLTTEPTGKGLPTGARDAESRSRTRTLLEDHSFAELSSLAGELGALAKERGLTNASKMAAELVRIADNDRDLDKLSAGFGALRTMIRETGFQQPPAS